MSKIGYILTALGSAAVAAGVTWYVASNHFVKILDEEIEDVKEYYASKSDKEPKKANKKETTQEEKAAEAQHKEDLMSYAKKLADERYSVEEESRKPFKAIDKEEPNFDVEYIDPQEFGMEEDGWDEISLSYYSDDILADELDEIIEGEERFQIVGNFEKHFGEFEADSVFVKNNKRKAYYEILAMGQKYGEKARPAKIEVV